MVALSSAETAIARQGNLSSWVSGASIASETTYKAQALRPMCRLNVQRLLSPSQSQRLSNVGRAMPVHEIGEIEQASACGTELEPQ
jgi:hypothetical protein